jgi:hypothetical protein
MERGHTTLFWPFSAPTDEMMKGTYLSEPCYRLHRHTVCYKASGSTTTVLGKLPCHLYDQPKQFEGAYRDRQL